ncbi:MAG: glycyl-radical enzyme activating protein [Chloroflexota bacterium]
MVFDIQRMSVHDGPGIRTTVFMKGCPLNCPWCHNPESQSGRMEIVFYDQRCIHCGACFAVCPHQAIDLTSPDRVNRDKCDGCGLCAVACPSAALVQCGRRVSAAEVVETVERDRPFYEASGGGVTLSGGEPLFQYAFAAAILARCRRQGIHTALETAAWSSRLALIRVLKYTDLVLLDLKTMDPSKHERVIGRPLDRVIANARLIAESGTPLVIRVPVVPGFNDSDESMEAIFAFAAELNGRVELLAYHRLAVTKYHSVGREYPMKDALVPSKERLVAIAALAAVRGLDVSWE